MLGNIGPEAVVPHSDAGTVLLCSTLRLIDYAPHLSKFGTVITFEEISKTFPLATLPLTTGEFDEWGDPKKKEYYDYMLSYSPYDNVARQAYPAMLVTTGLWDSQVQYWEPAKWVAKLRATKTDHNPLLFKIEMAGGHGGKSGRFASLGETAEEYAFLLHLLGISR
jgi:oligopeptidase B